LPEALAGAQVVVDVANSPSFEDAAVTKCFQTAGKNLLAAEGKAGVRHHVALSIVGADRLPDSGYLRAKVAQENLVKASGTPYTILRSTQFFEFGGLAEIALGSPANGTVEVGGPERLRFEEFVGRALSGKNDGRKVVSDLHARYFGTELSQDSLVPGNGARLGKTRLDAWLGHTNGSR
jgi:uncharacterized protein YbjT (DUF2867 family)